MINILQWNDNDHTLNYGNNDSHVSSKSTLKATSFRAFCRVLHLHYFLFSDGHATVTGHIQTYSQLYRLEKV